mmetsp:Transcript_10271/g.31742  ORF Transcript_10271/g.31742 Transcript_10271/m.31742 type:complete len:237 (-) Transcript_10271:154-864(-)
MCLAQPNCAVGDTPLTSPPQLPPSRSGAVRVLISHCFSRFTGLHLLLCSSRSSSLAPPVVPRGGLRHDAAVGIGDTGRSHLRMQFFLRSYHHSHRVSFMEQPRPVGFCTTTCCTLPCAPPVLLPLVLLPSDHPHGRPVTPGGLQEERSCCSKRPPTNARAFGEPHIAQPFTSPRWVALMLSDNNATLLVKLLLPRCTVWTLRAMEWNLQEQWRSGAPVSDVPSPYRYARPHLRRET